jgi:hypothetical protein
MYVKVMRSGYLPRAMAIQAAPTDLDAKQIGKNVLASQQFIDIQYNIMKEIVEAKLEQVQEFHDALKMHHRMLCSWNPHTTISWDRDLTN